MEGLALRSRVTGHPNPHPNPFVFMNTAFGFDEGQGAKKYEIAKRSVVRCIHVALSPNPHATCKYNVQRSEFAFFCVYCLQGLGTSLRRGGALLRPTEPTHP